MTTNGSIRGDGPASSVSGQGSYAQPMTAATFIARIEHLLGDSPATGYTSIEIVNDAMDLLFSSHPWRFSMAGPVPLTIYENVEYVLLPQDFGTPKHLTYPGNFYNSITPATLDQILMNRAHASLDPATDLVFAYAYNPGATFVPNRTAAQVDRVTGGAVADATTRVVTITMPSGYDFVRGDHVYLDDAGSGDIEAGKYFILDADATTITLNKNPLATGSTSASDARAQLYKANETLDTPGATSAENGYVRSLIELYPRPSSTVESALVLTYHRQPHVTSSTDIIPIPHWMNGSFGQLCRALASTIEDDDARSAAKEEYLSRLDALKRRDGMSSPNIGKWRGSVEEPMTSMRMHEPRIVSKT